MSEQEDSVRDRLNGQVRRLQRAAAVLACIQYVAEYEEDFEFSLADAVSVVVEIIDDVADAVRFIAAEIKAGGAAMINQESRTYFKSLGAHVTMLRKSRDMTQAELEQQGPCW